MVKLMVLLIFVCQLEWRILFLFGVDLVCRETDGSCFDLNVIICSKLVVFDIEENDEDMKGLPVYLYQKIQRKRSVCLRTNVVCVYSWNTAISNTG